jgi:hypothetical protein
MCRQLDVLQPETAMPRDDVVELFQVLRTLEAWGYWDIQEVTSTTDGRGSNDKSRFRMYRTHTSNDFGAWRVVKICIPEWPMGVILIREEYNDYNFQEVAEIIR